MRIYHREKIRLRLRNQKVLLFRSMTRKKNPLMETEKKLSKREGEYPNSQA